MESNLVTLTDALCRTLAALPEGQRIEAINAVKIRLHEISPFSSEPVDCVIWVPSDAVLANDYNPNRVASPEMKLLEHSIECDGYTQPIVVYQRNDVFEVVDGFHRRTVGATSSTVRARIHGHLPVTRIRKSQEGLKDRMASTIRHNRARGKHGVSPMADIVAELYQAGWKDDKIANELGMETDEVLRLKQTTGLAALFSDRDYSKAWELEDL